jgi:hypothetical protein
VLQYESNDVLIVQGGAARGGAARRCATGTGAGAFVGRQAWTRVATWELVGLRLESEPVRQERQPNRPRICMRFARVCSGGEMRHSPVDRLAPDEDVLQQRLNGAGGARFRRCCRCC